MTRSSIHQKSILIFSELLRAEYSTEDANPIADPHHHGGNDLDDDNGEAEPNSRALARVELARSVREFGPH